MTPGKLLTVVLFLAATFSVGASAEDVPAERDELFSPPTIINSVFSKGDLDKGASFFVDKSGTPLLTNRSYRYRDDPDYVEIDITYDPVSVPTRYASKDFDGTYTKGDIKFLVKRYARIYQLDENLIFAVIRAESNFDPFAVSRAGARGLMQLMPDTAKEMRVSNIYDPAQNIAGGTQYLAKLCEEFDDDMELVLAAYNAGPRTVKRYEGVPPYKETRDYIKRIGRFQSHYDRHGHDIGFETTTVLSNRHLSTARKR